MRRGFLLLSLLFVMLLFDGVLSGNAAPESENYKQVGWVISMGAAQIQSENYKISQVIGERVAGIVLNAVDRLVSGFLTLLDIGEGVGEEDNYDIDWVKAHTNIGGSPINPEQWQNDNTPYFTWDIKSQQVTPEGFSFSLDTEPDDEIDTTDRGYLYKQPISDGKHIFYVKAKKNGEGWGEMGTFHIWIDTQAPSAVYVYPSSGSLLNSRKENIRIRFSDALSGLDSNSIECRVNNHLVYLKYDKDKDEWVSYGLLPEGRVTVALSAKDNAGNEMADYLWGFSVDTIAPVGSVVINHDAPMTHSLQVVLSLDASDSFSGVVSVRVGASRSECESAQWMAFVPELEWSLLPYNGQQSVYVQFQDKAGNISSLYSDNILVDLLAPDTIITSGPTGLVEETDAFFRYQATEEDAYFSYKLDDGKWSRWSREDSVMLVGLVDGRHVFSVRAARDVNGNNVIDEEEIDPTPAQRIWFVGKVEIEEPTVKVNFWRVE